jgi:hypothetical protein
LTKKLQVRAVLERLNGELSKLPLPLNVLNFLLFVNSASLANNSGFVVVNIDVNNVVLVEPSCPPLWNPVLHFVA